MIPTRNVPMLTSVHPMRMAPRPNHRFFSYSGGTTKQTSRSGRGCKESPASTKKGFFSRIIGRVICPICLSQWIATTIVVSKPSSGLSVIYRREGRVMVAVDPMRNDPTPQRGPHHSEASGSALLSTVTAGAEAALGRIRRRCCRARRSAFQR